MDREDLLDGEPLDGRRLVDRDLHRVDVPQDLQGDGARLASASDDSSPRYKVEKEKEARQER